MAEKKEGDGLGLNVVMPGSSLIWNSPGDSMKGSFIRPTIYQISSVGNVKF
jgi:hypothetical protein